METKLGAHLTTGSRNGYGLVAPHLRGVVAIPHDAIIELSDDAYRIYRPMNGYGQGHLDIMPGFNNLTIEDMTAQAAYWWPRLRDEQVKPAEQQYGRIDCVKLTNEVGGNDPGDIAKLIAYERALLPLVAADGYKLGILSLGTGAPHWHLWIEHCVPFIREAWATGNAIYMRHAYFDHFPDKSLPRPFEELDYLRSLGPTGPMVLGELGWYTFPGVDVFIQRLSEYEQQMADYPEIGFAAIFTYGKWNNANIEAASGALQTYLQARPFTKWEPGGATPPPNPDPPPGVHKAIVVKLPQEVTEAERLAIATAVLSNRHTETYSHDDMMTILRGGNSESYAKIAFPQRPSQQQAIGLIQAAGYHWEVLPGFDDSSPGVNLIYRPCQTATITQPFGIGNYPGLPGHDGIDYAVQKDHPFYAAAAGVCVHASDRRWSSNTPSPYGWHVVLDHGDYCTVYAHARSDLPVSAGQQVAAGQIVGWSGNTGNSTGYHLHFGLLDKTGTIDPDNGFPNWTHGRAVDPWPFVQGKPAPPIGPPPPPPGPTIDLLPYVRGDGRLYEVRNAAGSQERFQTQVSGATFYQTKNAHWEEMIATSTHILRDRDTSPGGGRFYRLTETGQPQGSRWIPRHWQVGGEWTQARRVQFYDKVTCQPLPENSGDVTDAMRFVALHENYTFRTGIILPGVVELLWVNGGERYFYARDFGLVAWERLHADPHTPAWSAISEIHGPGARPDNQREAICQ